MVRPDRRKDRQQQHYFVNARADHVPRSQSRCYLYRSLRYRYTVVIVNLVCLTLIILCVWLHDDVWLYNK